MSGAATRGLTMGRGQEKDMVRRGQWSMEDKLEQEQRQQQHEQEQQEHGLEQN